MTNTYQQLRLSFLAALATVTTWGATSAAAQNVTFGGANGSYVLGCTAIADIPGACSTTSRSVLNPTSVPAWSMPINPRSGIYIGTNLTNTNTGTAATGSVTVTGGATVQNNYLYVGFEKNTTGSVEIGGAGSKWTNASAGSIGHYGTGSLTIRDGGQYLQTNPDQFYIGYAAGSSGTVVVDGITAAGSRSTLQVQNNINVGNIGTGSLSITNGALVLSGFSTFLGVNPGSSGSMLVSGVDNATGFRSTLNILNNNIEVGDMGTGIVNVNDGALISAQKLTLVGRFAGDLGILNVDGMHAATGDRSTVQSLVLRIADNGNGFLNVTNGGRVNSATTAFLGYMAGGVGIVNVDGDGSAVTAQGTAAVGYVSSGTLTLTDGGKFSAPLVQIGATSTATGVINIGNGGRAGILDTPVIQGGPGSATINFNHTDDIVFTPQLTGNINVTQSNSGVTTFVSANDYAGTTTVANGIWVAASANRFSANSDHAVNAGATLNLNGFNQTLRALKNSGVVQFSGQAGTVLTVNNNYVGDGGTLAFNAVLEGDQSLSDKLVIKGDSTGTSSVTVKNIDGLGARTVEGIKVIAVSGASTGKYTLVGNTTYDGAPAVVGGAYAYRLLQGGIADPTDQSWYLRSTLTQLRFVQSAQQVRDLILAQDPKVTLFQPGVPTYEAYQQILLGLNSMPTLQQRVGNRFWSDGGVVADADDGQETDAAAPHTSANGTWARVEAGHVSITPKQSTSDSTYEYDSSQIQIGQNSLLVENDSGKLVGGVFAHYVHGNAATVWNQSAGQYADGTLSTDGYGLGVALTWYGNNGVYVDGALQATRFSSDMSANPGHVLTTDNKATGTLMSLETGKRIALSGNWSVTPQLQLIYSRVSFNAFSDVFSAAVTPVRNDSLQGRLGISLDRQVKGFHLYGIANLYTEMLDGTSVVVGTDTFVNKNDRLWGGLGLGGSYSWGRGRYSVYGETSYNTSVANVGDSYGYGGTIGFRMKW